MIAFTPLDGAVKSVGLLMDILYEEGVIGFIAGKNPARIRFLLPFLHLQDSDIPNCIKIIENALIKTHQKLKETS